VIGNQYIRKAFGVGRFPFPAISDFASSSGTPEATSDKAAMSAFLAFPGEWVSLKNAAALQTTH
jgi:hypothetical protein